MKTDRTTALTPGRSLARDALLVALGTAVIAIAARIQVPMWPVPMTLQSLAVVMVGMAYGRRLGVVTLTAYILEGAAGLPVFASGGGLAYLTGPTGGYIFGFLAAAALVGHLAGRGWAGTSLRAAGTAAAGMAVIYLLGVGWLALTLGLSKAIAVGALPFVPGDLLKIAILALAFPRIGRLLPRL